MVTKEVTNRMIIDVKKARKKLKGNKWGMRLCRAYVQLKRENELLHFRALEAERQLVQMRRSEDEGEEGL